MFEGAAHFTLEGIKVVPQMGDQQDFIFKELKMNPSLFTQMGLLNMKPEYRLRYYRPFIDYFKEHNISYSISDNDLRKYTNNKCCCGDKLVPCSTRFNTTRLIVDNPKGYTINDVKAILKEDGVYDCQCFDLFTSNRTQGCKTVGQFFSRRFGQASSPFSPNFQYQGDRQLCFFDDLPLKNL